MTKNIESTNQILASLSKIILKNYKAESAMHIGNLNVTLTMLTKAYDIYKSSSKISPIVMRTALLNLAAFLEGAGLKKAAQDIKTASNKVEDGI